MFVNCSLYGLVTKEAVDDMMDEHAGDVLWKMDSLTPPLFQSISRAMIGAEQYQETQRSKKTALLLRV